MDPQMRKDTIDKLKTTKCCLKKGGKSHDPGDCRSPLCQCGRAPPHNELICLYERIQMTNLQPSYQMIECDQETAEQHMAMAEMMKEGEGEPALEPTVQDQTNLMQFSTIPGATYQNADQMYSFEINDFSYYLSSFYSNIPDSEINTIASNVKHIMRKDPSNTQLLEKEISKIFQ